MSTCAPSSALSKLGQGVFNAVLVLQRDSPPTFESLSRVPYKFEAKLLLWAVGVR